MNYDIGQRIRKFRQEKSIKQEVLAHHLQIKQSTLSKIENGIISITVEQLIKVGNYFKINLSQLIPEDLLLLHQIDVNHQIKELHQEVKLHKDTHHQLIKRIASLEYQLEANNLPVISKITENHS